jgi:hypothetical protein
VSSAWGQKPSGGSDNEPARAKHNAHLPVALDRGAHASAEAQHVGQVVLRHELARQRLARALGEDKPRQNPTAKRQKEGEAVGWV